MIIVQFIFLFFHGIIHDPLKVHVVITNYQMHLVLICCFMNAPVVFTSFSGRLYMHVWYNTGLADENSTKTLCL